MKPLETNKQMLKWLYLYPMDKSTSVWKKLAYLSWALTFSGHLSALWLRVCHLEKALFELFQIFGSSNQSYMFMIAFFMRHKIADIYKHLAMIYDASKTPIKLQ